MTEIITHPFTILLFSAIVVPTGIGVIRWPIKVNRRLTNVETKHEAHAEASTHSIGQMEMKIDKLDQRVVDLTDFLLREMPRRPQ